MFALLDTRSAAPHATRLLVPETCDIVPGRPGALQDHASGPKPAANSRSRSRACPSCWRRMPSIIYLPVSDVGCSPGPRDGHCPLHEGRASQLMLIVHYMRSTTDRGWPQAKGLLRARPIIKPLARSGLAGYGGYYEAILLDIDLTDCRYACHVAQPEARHGGFSPQMWPLRFLLDEMLASHKSDWSSFLVAARTGEDGTAAVGSSNGSS